jgi:Arc/MetJ-type ribon-helix-helix transcriptional regulator
MSVERERRYVTVSLPVGIIKAIDALIEELGYWPSRGAFVREACLEKIWSERKKIRELMNNTDSHADPCEVEGLTGGLTRG